MLKVPASTLGSCAPTHAASYCQPPALLRCMQRCKVARRSAQWWYNTAQASATLPRELSPITCRRHVSPNHAQGEVLQHLSGLADVPSRPLFFGHPRGPPDTGRCIIAVAVAPATPTPKLQVLGKRNGAHDRRGPARRGLQTGILTWWKGRENLMAWSMLDARWPRTRPPARSWQERRYDWQPETTMWRS